MSDSASPRSARRPAGALDSPLRQLTELSRAVSQAASLDDILNLAAEQAAAMLHGDQTLLLLCDDDGRVHPRAWHGVSPDVLAGIEGALDEGFIGRLRQRLIGDEEGAFLTVPLIVQGKVTGILAVTRRGGAAWEPDDEATLSALADQSAAPIEIARLSEEVRQARLTAENMRLSEAERAARRALESSEAQYWATFELLGVGQVQVDAATHRFVRVNETFCELLGYSAEELLARTVTDVTHPDDRDRALATMESLAGGGIDRLETEKRYCRGDGRIIWVSVSLQGLSDESGRVTRIVAAIQDITAGRVAAAEIAALNTDLSRRVSELEGLLHVIPIGIAIADDPECVTIRSNPALHAMLRLDPKHNASYSAPAVERPPFLLVQDGRVLEPHEPPMQLAAATGRTVVGSEFDVVWQDGRHITLLGSAAPVHDAEGRVRGCVGAFIDVTERRQQEDERRKLTEALAEERTRLATVLENIPVGMVLAEAPSGRVLFSNREAARLLRTDDLSAAGMSAYRGYQAFHSDGRPYAPEEWPLARALLHGEAVLGEEIDIVRGDGSRSSISANAAPIRDADGRVIAAVSAFADVTDRRQSEAHLRQVQQMELVGRLAGGVAHEANNQMAVVLGAAEFILALTDLAQVVRDDVEHIRRAAQRTAAVTAQLLAYSRRQLLRPQVLDLAAMVAELAPVLRRALGEESTLVLRPAVEAGLVRADRGQLEQVLINLVINARDAMRGGGQLTIETRVVELTADYAGMKPSRVRPGRYVQLTVSDEGHGMDRETLGHAFEPFFTTKEIGQGTGLGLSTVYGIVKQSEGYVWAYSEGGQGTTFKIYLPLVSDAPSAPAPPRSPAAAGPGETVLVVEDEPMVRSMVMRALQLQGYTVLAAADGAAALEVVGTATVRLDLIVSDVAMPRLNGRELSERLHLLRPALPVLFMSGYTDDEIVRRGLMEAGRPFLGKPFTPDELVRRVRLLLDEAAAQHS